jgi:ataxin-10
LQGPNANLVVVYSDLLRTTESFIPRVKPFRPNDASSTESSDGTTGLTGFAPLKRDLVQLAGLLANDDKATQDQIRECGGMQVILSMCVTDDRNPRKHICYHYTNGKGNEWLTPPPCPSLVIREYALLAVRNLMIDNEANQAIIKEMDPVGMVGPDGELREMPARMGVKK